MELNVLLGSLLGSHQVNLINNMINIIILTIPIIIINWHILRLPYDPELGRKLLSPPELLKRQPVSKTYYQKDDRHIFTSNFCSLQFLPVVRMPGELSDQEEEEVEEVNTTMMTKMMSPARNTHTSPD